MSDLSAANCGCGCETDRYCGDNGCCNNSCLWIILLLFCCGGGNGCGGNHGGCNDSCLWIILLPVSYTHLDVYKRQQDRSILYFPASYVLLLSYDRDTTENAYFLPHKSKIFFRGHNKPCFSVNITPFYISYVCISAVLTIFSVISKYKILIRRKLHLL